jgi:hypothetical protein
MAARRRLAVTNTTSQKTSPALEVSICAASLGIFRDRMSLILRQRIVVAVELPRDRAFHRAGLTDSSASAGAASSMNSTIAGRGSLIGDGP